MVILVIFRKLFFFSFLHDLWSLIFMQKYKKKILNRFFFVFEGFDLEFHHRHLVTSMIQMSTLDIILRNVKHIHYKFPLALFPQAHSWYESKYTKIKFLCLCLWSLQKMCVFSTLTNLDPMPTYIARQNNVLYCHDIKNK